jgi:hypothetical protein
MGNTFTSGYKNRQVKMHRPADRSDSQADNARFQSSSLTRGLAEAG